MARKPTKRKPTARKAGPIRTALAYDDALMQLEHAHARLDLLLHYVNEHGSLDGLASNTQLCAFMALEEDLEKIKELLDEGWRRECRCDHGPWPTMEADIERNAARKAAFDSFMAQVLPGGEGASHA